MINDVLDYSAIEANKRNIDKEEIDVFHIINDCLRTISPLSEKKKIQIKIDSNPELPALFADKRSVKQIMINVLSNAVKFTPTEGNVTIKADTDLDNIIIKVSDTGEGITNDNIVKILEPFARVENNPHLPQEGTGLGLSIVQSLITLHDGKLNIESEIGVGTTVEIYFPKN